MELDEPELLHGVALFFEFLGGGVQLGAGESVDLQALHDLAEGMNENTRCQSGHRVLFYRGMRKVRKDNYPIT